MEEDGGGGRFRAKNKHSTVTPCLLGGGGWGEDGLTLQGDINMQPAEGFRWCCGEGFLDNVSDRGEDQLKTQKPPQGWN